MANQAHVDLLLESVEKFNAWRQANLEEVPDLIDVDLSGVDLLMSPAA